ncbi:MAG: type II toxin-antitoxin system VapC family toxin [Burkholderiales bacterium]|nr:type II toxin-antitoxin system VapC family toxin [Burkholderiales bacterium]
MRILLDTHLLLWSVARSRRLSREARRLLLDPANELFFSAGSLWEVAIKYALRRTDFDLDPATLLDALAQTGIDELPVKAAHAARVAALPAVHGDPFDRLLVAQSLAEPMTLLTHDRSLAGYGATVRVV